jgi:TolB-like protein/class 3 adenylate cyclase/Tfp pilus assembly protein PilF
MSAEVKKEIQLEIAHVLFIDIVGYSKLLINEQRALLDTLNQMVRGTDQFRSAEAAGRLIKIPTGDGMALVFYNSPEAPVECALEVSRALKTLPNLQLRMGVHSGPVSGVVDVNERANVAGAGINVAQRVMDCGDAGHILLSKHVAEDLEQYGHWQPHLHDLGECEVKHGERVSIVNLYTDELGNPEPPEKFSRLPAVEAAVSAAKKKGAQTSSRKYLLIAGAVITAVALGLLMFRMVGTDRRAVRANSAEDHGRPNGASLPVPEKSIAVLPFDNFSADKENAFFADGVQDDILTALAKVADLKVISRTSVMGYAAGATRNLAEIGRALGVAHVLEGSVRRAGGKVRVTAQLIDTRTDSHLWADTYDRDLADVFAIQSEIAQKIANQLQAKLSSTEKAAIEERPTKDLAAYELYVRAKVLNASTSFNARAANNLLEAGRLLDQAIARDPGFFLAYCQLAQVQGLIYFLGGDHTQARVALADRAVKAALRLRPQAGEAHLAQAEYLYRCFLDYERARAELALAERALPNSSQVFELTGYIDRRQGRWNESARSLEKALELDPRNFFILQQISLSYQSLRRYADMAAVLERALVLVPRDVDTRVIRALVDLDWRAKPQPLHETIQAVVTENPAAAVDVADSWLYLALCERDPAEAKRAVAAISPEGISTDAVIFSPAFCQGLAARARGDAAAAQSAFTTARTELESTMQGQPEYGPRLCVLGMIDAALGRKEQAIREGRRAVELTPAAKDSLSGAQIMKYLAVIYAWTGEKDRAIEQIAATVKIPGDLSYGQLKLHPYWDALRGDPRFEKIVASLAPKDAK